MREKGFQLKHGYVVIAIPKSGLFVKEGKIVTGRDTVLRFSELILFSREADAQAYAQRNRVYWSDGEPHGESSWAFQVLPVLVSERL